MAFAEYRLEQPCDTEKRNAAAQTWVSRARPMRRLLAQCLTARSVTSRRMSRWSDWLEGASSKVFIRDRVEVAHPLLHEPLHRASLATTRKLLDQRGSIRDVTHLV